MRPATQRSLFAVVTACLLLVACGQQARHDTASSHIVRRGETLFSIAFRYGKDPAELARWNQLGDGSLIYPGQVIRLYPSTSVRLPARRPFQNCAHCETPAHPPP